MPAPAEPARQPNAKLPKSAALSILANGPKDFKGRKVGALITDGVDAGLVKALRQALKKEGAVLRLVAPMVGGVEASDGSWIEAQEKIDGGPSILFDAVVLLVSDEGAKLLANEATARDFIADAYAHLKFIGFVDAAKPLLQKAGVELAGDEGLIPLGRAGDMAGFVETCRTLRYWKRGPRVKQV